MSENGFKKTKIIVTVSLGVLLTVTSFIFYFIWRKQWLNIICGLVCFFHMVYLMYFKLTENREFTKKEKIVYPTVLLIIFYGVLIGLISLIDPLGKFCLDYVLWVLYAGASIMPLFYIILLLISFAH